MWVRKASNIRSSSKACVRGRVRVRVRKILSSAEDSSAYTQKLVKRFRESVCACVRE
jgi:hypothetical protein